MTEAIQFVIGSEARCSDGVCGEVTRVVVDPVARAVTHLVVEPKHRQGLGRLVPLTLVDEASTGASVRLNCTIGEFEKLAHAEESQFLPASGGHADYPAGQVLSQPFYGLSGVIGDVPQVVTYDSLPLDEVALRRGEHVEATDGNIGIAQGLVLDPSNHHVTHVLLQEGHVWGRKQVAIPIGAVSHVDSAVRLSISKQQVEDLPAVAIEPS